MLFQPHTQKSLKKMEEIQIIETDFQVGAQVAMWALATIKNPNKTKIKLYVIVGEGRSHNKIPLVLSFYNVLLQEYPKAYSRVIVVEGLPSDDNYPVDAYETPPKSEADILLQYKNIYDLKPTKVWMMKPPREAIKTKVTCPGTIVYCHGGFDWAKLKITATSEFVSLVNRYKAFYYYTSTQAIGPNNIHKLFYNPNQHTKLIHPILTFLSRSAILWNFQIVSELEYQSSDFTLSEEARDRKLRILKSVQASGVHQFILNYVMLVYCKEPDKQVEFTGFETFKPSTTSKMFVFSDVGIEMRRANLVARVMELNNSFIL